MLSEERIQEAYEQFKRSLERHKKTIPNDRKEELEKMISEKNYDWFKAGIKKDATEQELDKYTKSCEADNFIELYSVYKKR